MNNQSLSHSRYNCTYHIVFIPKYRRKEMFGDLRREVGEAISKVCKLEGVTIIKAATLPNHVQISSIAVAGSTPGWLPLSDPFLGHERIDTAILVEGHPFAEGLRAVLEYGA